ncbi:exported hypothetical protein [Candidatus Sulfotelmatomonas gaucii]|uniref:Lipoprotein n=1 Tax=Candidatus Sulfuritelmatomonas gaucii TaxID=2043161 RepID=A0A2N9MAG1_9BACT|nr:exported hypothetical protein [Candidatus Sulfotelmatomonas gaucii]
MSGSRMTRLVFWVVTGVLAGCSRRADLVPPSQPEIKAVPATPIAEKKTDLGVQTWNPEWNRIVEQALPPEMLSARAGRDVRPFCPRFNAMSDGNRRAFWAYFFQALAGAEAGLVPTADVRHTDVQVPVKDTVTKRMVRSEGLLQLTYMDPRRYGCDFDWDKDKLLLERDPTKTILQPMNNLTCGVKILDNQLIAQRKPLLSQSGYWSTLRPGGPSYRVFAKQMTNVPAVCRQAPSLGESKTAIAYAKPATEATRDQATGLK